MRNIGIFPPVPIAKPNLDTKQHIEEHTVKTIIAFIKSVLNRASKKRVAKKLLHLSDRQLDDIGISRTELRKGVSAYPWRVSSHLTVVSSARRVTSRINNDFDQRDLVA
ncbi:hypothetical protein AB835_09495 [Candidatus Endobugula sertula]|uniref:YjiS-like domain-containing protein n=1 Tax=Candidatus Endobugula sertula TaxID=62101 RepID=A0A1D2QNZ4_9GAMM|nr:hypothetical protein AB835_09495 [Candidatus Endobugula sertula]